MKEGTVDHSFGPAVTDAGCLVLWLRVNSWKYRKVMAGTKPPRRIPRLLSRLLATPASSGTRARWQAPGKDVAPPCDMIVARVDEVPIKGP